jgi:hypothetical protein
LLLIASASAGGGGAASGAIYDITHFDVLPVTSPFDSEQIAYKALFAYRDASKSDRASKISALSTDSKRQITHSSSMSGKT